MCLFLFLALRPAFADLTPVNGAAVASNIAEISVSEEGVLVTLEIYAEDLAVFKDLLPDSWVPSASDVRPAEADRLKNFSNNIFSIRSGSGDALAVEVLLIEPRIRVDRASPISGKIDPITGRKIPKPPEDPRVIYVELNYDFSGQKPDRLEFRAPTDAEGNPLLSIGMIVFDREVPVTDFRYLTTAAKLSINWDDPWYSKFDNPNLRRHHRFPVMTFLYAEPYEIRFEALMRIREAASLVGVKLKGDYLKDEESEAIAAALPALVKQRSPMTIDGQSVVPDFVRLSVLRVGPSGLVFLEEGEKVRTDAAILGLIYSAPTDQFAKEASVEWTLFSDTVQQIPAQTIDAAGPFISELTVEEPVLTWTNYFKKSPYPEITAISVDEGTSLNSLFFALVVGTAGLGLVFAASLFFPSRVSRRTGVLSAVFAAVLLAAIPVTRSVQNQAVLNVSDEQMAALSKDMLNNIYRSFDFKLEDQVYDRLALTLGGDVLEKIYLEQRATLRVERAGGAQARVDSVEVLNVNSLPAEAKGELKLLVEWTISGIVGHWGHDHRRTNDYTAELVIRPENGAWKIVDFDMLSQERRL